MLTEGIVDIELWVSSDGMGRIWDQVHSLSYQHNLLVPLVPNPLQKLWYQVNLTGAPFNSTTSYTPRVKLNASTALLLYECDTVSATPGVVWSNGHFAMAVSV